MEQTIKEYLNELPEPHFSKVLKYCYKQGKDNVLEEKIEANLFIAMLLAFKWDDTDEKAEHWLKVAAEFFKTNET